jgi:hypothetical protein
MDPVRSLQHALYRAAKADPGRRFHALGDKVHRRDVLERAWEDVRRNRGAAGIDRITITDVQEYGVSRLLDEVAATLREGRWRPLPARRVFIPKPGSTEQRPLSIPTDLAYDEVRQVACGFGVVVPGRDASVSPVGRSAAAGVVRASLQGEWAGVLL